MLSAPAGPARGSSVTSFKRPRDEEPRDEEPRDEEQPTPPPTEEPSKLGRGAAAAWLGQPRNGGGEARRVGDTGQPQAESMAARPVVGAPAPSSRNGAQCHGQRAATNSSAGPTTSPASPASPTAPASPRGGGATDPAAAKKALLEQLLSRAVRAGVDPDDLFGDGGLRSQEELEGMIAAAGGSA